MKTTKKLIAGLTALLCFSGMNLPVSAKYYDDFREFKSCSDQENVIFAEEDGIEHVYITYPDLKHQFMGCVVQTDGTVITEDLLGDDFDSVVSWNTWKEQRVSSQTAFRYLTGGIPEIENPENTYVLHPVWGADEISVLNACAQEHDFIQNAMLLYTDVYELSRAQDNFYIIASDDVTLTLSDFPELEEAGISRLRICYPDEENADTDGETLWSTFGTPSAFADEEHVLSDTEKYEYSKALEKQLNEAYPEYDFIANFAYDVGNADSLFSYELEPLPEASEILTGDVDQDGNINILDVILLNRAIMGKAILTDIQNQTADVNHDGTADSSDSLLIMKYIVGLITEF